MNRRVLFCADGSDQSCGAARLTVGLVLRLPACVDVINVLDPLSIVGGSAFAPNLTLSSSPILSAAQAGQRSVLDKIGSVFTNAGVEYETSAAFGHPVEQICRHAQACNAELIIMGSRGLNSWSSVLLGSVSEGVAHHAHTPVLIVRGDPTVFHKIIIASDASEGALHAACSGLALARDYQAAAIVLNIFEWAGTQPAQGSASARLAHGSAATSAAAMAAAVKANTEPVARSIGVCYCFKQEVGHPAEAIVRFAEEKRADLIVLGTRGLGGFKRLVLGSVSTSVLQHAHCSVLIAR